MSRSLADWLAAYLDYTSHLEAPSHMSFWAGVSTVAGALRGKCWIDMGGFSWKPNFYIVLVAPPGIVTKSTTVGQGHKLLQKIKNINFGPNSTSWQALFNNMEEVQESMVISPEGAQPQKKKTMANISFFVSELGSFLNFNDKEMVDNLVDWWDGADTPWKRSTVGGGVKIVQSPWLNLIAATTPAWIQESVPEYAIGGGFISRTIFLYADQKERFIAYPCRHMKPDHTNLEQDLINDLLRISQMRGEFRLTEKAFAFGEWWYNTHWKEMDKHLQHTHLQGYIARKQAHLHKLAMVLSAAQSDSMEITEEHLNQGLKILRGVEDQMAKVFSGIGGDVSAKHNNLLMSLIQMEKKVPEALLFRKVMSHMNYFTFQNTMKGLYASKAVKQVQEGMTIYAVLNTN